MRFFASFSLGLLLLTSCGGRGENALKHSAAAEVQRAHMALRVLEEHGETRKIGLIIQNPTEIPIQSVRAWVRFDPLKLALTDLVVEDSRFVLFAPGEREIDNEEGFLKFGGAVTSALSDREILIATFTARLLSDDGGFDRPLLAFYDWRKEGDGHTAVLSLSEDELLPVLNIVQPPSGLSL